MVPVHRWYIERTVWLIAGIVLLSSTVLALLVNPLCILGVLATGLVSINVAFTGFCPVGNVLQLLGFTPMLGSKSTARFNWYRCRQTAGISSAGSASRLGSTFQRLPRLILTVSAWFSLFTLFVGGAMVWFAATGFCVMANALHWLGAEPRLNPDSAPSARCEQCGLSGVCVGGHQKTAGEAAALVEPQEPGLLQVL
jgi:hypothetical protein